MTISRKILSAAALVAVASSALQAQTDFGSPVGAGGGLGASVAPLGVPATFAYEVIGAPVTVTGREFVSSPAGGSVVWSPAGGTVTVPQAAAQALGAVLTGAASPAQLQTLNAALGGGTANGALVSALQALAANPRDVGARNAAVNAYNAAIRATPSGQTPTATMVAVRSVLSGTGAF